MLRWAAVIVVLSGCVRALPEPEMEARCEDGLARHCLDLGLARLGRQNIAGAVRAFERGCARSSVQACSQLDVLHGRAWLSVPAMQRSLEQLTPACAGGDAVACALERELRGNIAQVQDEIDRADAALADAVAVDPVTCDGKAGGLKKEELRTVIERRSVDVRACYEALLWSGVLIDIDVTLAWRIGEDGQVISASVAKDTRPESGVAPCIRRAVLSWRFPRPRCGVTA